MKDAGHLSNVRDRSRSARERSRSLRVTSQQLRDSLENLRAYGAEVNRGPGREQAASFEPHPPPRTPLDFAALMRQRVRKARLEAQELRRRATDLRNQAAEVRARAENLCSGSATF